MWLKHQPIELLTLSPFFFLFFLFLPLGCGDSGLGGLPFCWGCSHWELGGGDGEGLDTGGLLLSSLVWVSGCCVCCSLFPLVLLMLFLSSFLESVVGTGAGASDSLIRDALVSVAVVGAVPLASFTVTSELLGNSGAFFTAASHEVTLEDCLAFTLPLASSWDEAVLWRVTDELVWEEKPFSLLCNVVGWRTGSILGSFWSGSRISVWSCRDFPFCKLSRTFWAVCLRGCGLFGRGAVFSFAFSFLFFFAARGCCNSCSRSSSFCSAASSSSCRCRRCCSSNNCCSSLSRASASSRAFSSSWSDARHIQQCHNKTPQQMYINKLCLAAVTFFCLCRALLAALELEEGLLSALLMNCNRSSTRLWSSTPPSRSNIVWCSSRFGCSSLRFVKRRRSFSLISA